MPWSISIRLPYPPLSPARMTRPVAVACTGVPLDTAKSTPWWKSLGRLPNGELMGVLDDTG